MLSAMCGKFLEFPLQLLCKKLRRGRERERERKKEDPFDHFLNISPNYQLPLTLSSSLPIPPTTTDPYILCMVIVDTKSYLSFCRNSVKTWNKMSKNFMDGTEQRQVEFRDFNQFEALDISSHRAATTTCSWAKVLIKLSYRESERERRRREIRRIRIRTSSSFHR